MKIEILRNGQGHMKCPFLSSLNKVNQELKKYSDKYIISLKDGYVIHVDRKASIIGDALSKIESPKDLENLREEFPEKTNLIIFPDAVYGALKEYKKQLDYIELTDDNKLVIRLMDSDNAIMIGECYYYALDGTDSELSEKVAKFIEYHSSVIADEHKHKFTSLTDEQIERISESIYKCKMGDFNIRLTKQLVPGVSNKMDVSLFINLDRETKTSSGTLCPLYIRTSKNDVVSILIYNIIKY